MSGHYFTDEDKEFGGYRDSDLEDPPPPSRHHGHRPSTRHGREPPRSHPGGHRSRDSRPNSPRPGYAGPYDKGYVMENGMQHGFPGRGLRSVNFADMGFGDFEEDMHPSVFRFDEGHRGFSPRGPGLRGRHDTESIDPHDNFPGFVSRGQFRDDLGDDFDFGMGGDTAKCIPRRGGMLHPEGSRGHRGRHGIESRHRRGMEGFGPCDDFREGLSDDDFGSEGFGDGMPPRRRAVSGSSGRCQPQDIRGMDGMMRDLEGRYSIGRGGRVPRTGIYGNDRRREHGRRHGSGR